jgi:hypothetical protein
MICTISYPVALSDILRLYIMLFLSFAIVLPLLRFPRMLLSLSFALYVATCLFDLQIPGLPIGDDDLVIINYNPLTWQLLLVIGAVMMMYPSVRPLPHPMWDRAAVAVVLAAFAMRVSQFLAGHGYGVTEAFSWGPLIIWMQHSVDNAAKARLHPLRLANILAWAWLAYRLHPLYAEWLRRSWARPFTLCGQHSLPVFIFGVFLAPLGGMWLATWTGLAGQMAYNVAGAAMLVSVATVAAVAKKPRPRPISS